MMRGLVLGFSAILLAAASGQAEEPKSGLQVGDSAGAFNVRDVTGPSAGESLCYR